MSHTLILAALLRLVMCLVITSLAPHGAAAMQVTVWGDQLVLSGPVVGDEVTTLGAVFAAHSGIKTVILRNSPGGDAPAGYRVGEMFRSKGLRTAVSGYCYSSCSRMFLGGKTRVFTDDYPVESTEVGFHGHYDDRGRLSVGSVQALGLKDWIVRFSDGKADPALVDRWINIPFGRGMAHFFHPTRLPGRGATTFICQGNETTATAFDCERVMQSALDLGVITSLEVISSNDQEALRAPWLSRPAPSGFAEITDVARLPIQKTADLHRYQDYLAATAPKAFAISLRGITEAWNAGTFDAMQLALRRCEERAHEPCRLYAVDSDVVWRPGP